MIHRHQLEFEAAGPVEPVNLFLYCRVHDALADILVDSAVGKAQIVLVRQTGEPVGGGLDQEFSGRPSSAPRAMTSSVVYIPKGEKAPVASP